MKIYPIISSQEYRKIIKSKLITKLDILIFAFITFFAIKSKIMQTKNKYICLLRYSIIKYVAAGFSAPINPNLISSLGYQIKD